MKHVPHLVISAPWNADPLPLSVVTWRHVNKVLRLSQGDRVSYTDGLGRIGNGRLGNQSVERGEEQDVPRPTELSVAVAPPANKDRLRFLVEKLTELGVAQIQWLRTTNGKNRLVTAPKVFAWAVAALEQSRGAWLPEISTDLVGWDELAGPVVVCDLGGGAVPDRVATVAIGPEGGWAEGEVPSGLATWDLGPTVLRTETAAIIAAARVLAT